MKTSSLPTGRSIYSSEFQRLCCLGLGGGVESSIEIRGTRRLAGGLLERGKGTEEGTFAAREAGERSSLILIAPCSSRSEWLGSVAELLNDRWRTSRFGRTISLECLARALGTGRALLPSIQSEAPISELYLLTLTGVGEGAGEVGGKAGWECRA